MNRMLILSNIVNFPVTTITANHRVELTWKHPRRWIKVAFQVT
jgi:hypothetical protein